MSFAMSLAVERIRASWRRPRGVTNRIAASGNVALMFLVQSTRLSAVEASSLWASANYFAGAVPPLMRILSVTTLLIVKAHHPKSEPFSGHFDFQKRAGGAGIWLEIFL